MKLKHILTHSILSTLAFCSLYAHTQPNAQDPEKAPRPGQVVIPSSTTPQYAHAIPNQEQKRDGVFRKLQADTMVVNNTLTADTIHVQHFDVAQTTFENLDVLQTLTTKNLFVTSGAQITGQGTTQAPALRLLGLPNTPTPTDTILTIDGSGNVINSGATIGSLAGGTSSNVPGAVVQRNLLDGGFSAGTITALGLIGNLTGNVSGDVIGNVSGAASANVLKVGDTMSGQLRITDASDAALVLTGQGTTQAPALRLHGLPNTSTPTDTILTLDGSGNVINSGATIGSLAGGTSSNVPNTLVLRDGSGNFATSAITLNSGTTGVAALNNVGSADTGLYFPAAGQVALTAGSTQQLVANSTGIGIGTTPFTQLVVAGPLSVAGNLAVDAGPHGIYLQGRYLYIANVGADTMSIVDVSNSNNPLLVSTLSGLSNPRAISVQGRYAYVTNSDIATMSIVDIANPSNPVIVGTVSGISTPISLYVQGRYAYVLDDATNVLTVVDISSPSSPAVVGTLGGIDAFVVRVQGTYAYTVGNGTPEMKIIDVSNPASPTLVSTTALIAGASDIVLQGRYAYVIVGQAVQIFDISTPTLPTSVSTFSLAPDTPFALAIEGRYLYTVNNGSNMMSVIDVSDPTTPVLARSLVQASGGSSSLIAQGRCAYFVEDTANTLHIVDLGGAYIQQLETGGLETGTLATRENCAIGNDLDVKGGVTIGRTLEVNSDAAFGGSIAVGQTLRLYDATGAEYVGLKAPNTVTTSYTLTLPTDQGTAANQVLAQSSVLGQLTWLGATSSNSANTLVTRDNSGNFATSAITLDAGTTGATALNFAGSAGTGLYSPGANQLALVASSAQKLYANSTGVGIGTSSPFTQLTVDGSLALIGSIGVGSGISSICIQGRYVYTVSQTSNTMSIVDVSNPSNPIIVGTQTGLNSPYAVSVQGNYAYVADNGSNSLVIIDIKNPSSPAIVGTVSGLTPRNLYVQGRYAYVSDGSLNSMSIVDVSDPQNGYIVGTQSILGPLSLYVQGRYAYVLEGNTDSLVTIDVSNPSNPVLVGTLSLSSPGTLRSIYVQGRYAYIAAYQRLLIIDVKNPAAPAITSVFPIVGFNAEQTVYVQGRYAYVGSSGSPVMSVVDVSDPNNPFLVRQRQGSSGFDIGNTLVVQGRYAYGVTNAAQLEIIDLGGAYIQQLETGGLETGTLASRENVAIGNDLDVKGGTTVGANLFVNGQITAMNVSGSATTPVSISPIRLVNVPTGTNNALSVDASGYVTQASSSRRFKENIVPLSAESDLLYTLTPVKYDFNAEHSGRKNLYGFIAEDVAGVYPSIVNYDGQGLPCNYVADTLHALTIKEVQKQKQKLDAHDGIIKALLITIASMQAQIATLQVQ